MNKYQQEYLNIYYDGKKPRNKVGKEELELLGNIKGDKIRVHFPDFNGINGFKPAHVEEYQITDKCDMPNGKISVEVLSRNLSLWTERGYQIDYLPA